MKRWIFHVDVNSAYLSWEAAYRCHHLGADVDLRDGLYAVGGDAALRHGIILAKSMKAGQFGVATGESIFQARQKCPKLHLVPPNYMLYERCSEAFIKILKAYTPLVEQYSIDEAFMDVSDVIFEKSAEALAFEIKERIKNELGFTVNIGIGDNKLLAKMAGDFEKPDKIHTLYQDEIRYKMWPLPVERLFFVGEATKKKLWQLGIHTIGALGQTDKKILKSHLKKHGILLWQFANGIDPSEVVPVLPPNKGYGNSTTLPFDVADTLTLSKVFLSLSENIGRRLRRDGVLAGVLTIAIKNSDFFKMQHQMTLGIPTDITKEIYQYAVRLMREAWNGLPVRHAAIHAGKIVKDSGHRQYMLFETEDYEKLKRADRAVDAIRKRYGKDAVKRAVFVNQPLDHMAGGVSKEKQTDEGKLDENYERAAVLCWFTAGHKAMPLMMKLTEADGQLIQIDHLQVVCSEKKFYAGILVWEYRCRAQVEDTLKEFILMFYPETMIWKIKRIKLKN